MVGFAEQGIQAETGFSVHLNSCVDLLWKCLFYHCGLLALNDGDSNLDKVTKSIPKRPSKVVEALPRTSTEQTLEKTLVVRFGFLLLLFHVLVR